MSEAPEKIWALYAPEIEADNPQCTIVAGESVMHGAQQYTRSDLATARIAELEAALSGLAGVIERHGDWDDGCFYYSRTSAPELQGPLLAARAALKGSDT